MTPERFDEIERLLAESGRLSKTEVEEVRLLLRLWRKVSGFVDSLGWIGKWIGKLALWIVAVWAVADIFLKNRP